ncbi:DUF2971 domain-containing protein [Tsukamurella paurometabola]|uniref:DUF2971 domain-containing protein n=1 Tax=Tsukamurella paurometabola TaxID=2061 RepID=A0ABS5NIR1_TSUPA|nr:DUF2971 domain-containing protein [Tsukamurella paurometabola]MBS4104176.1 DUF2971 domain-containing protein [Tsukamurella paurometabola]
MQPKSPEEETQFYLSGWTAILDDLREDGDLYHYTDIGGLKGILDSRTLWCTHARYLNDSSEYEHGLSEVRRLLLASADFWRSSPSRDHSNPDQDPQTFEGMAQVIDDAGLGSEDSVPLVTCLSKAPDTLSQWRGYGPRGGYCIKFDQDALEADLKYVDDKGRDLHGIPKLNPVRYRSEDVYPGIMTAIQTHREQREYSLREGTSGGHSQVELLEGFISIATHLKHPSFFEEREHRLSVSMRESFYTPSKLGLVPRGRIGFDIGAVREIMVGPGENTTTRVNSLRRYLRTTGLEGRIDVTTSQIPYREP